MEQVKVYFAKVEEVHSGDDLILLVDLGVDRLYKRVRCRLEGVDTPNAFRSKGATEAGSIREKVKALITNDCRIEVRAQGKGGWLVRLYIKQDKTHEEFCLNDLLIQQGYVYKGRDDGTKN